MELRAMTSFPLGCTGLLPLDLDFQAASVYKPPLCYTISKLVANQVVVTRQNQILDFFSRAE